jgi:hypothetical protein
MGDLPPRVTSTATECQGGQSWLTNPDRKDMDNVAFPTDPQCKTHDKRGDRLRPLVFRGT